jgi:hypothetical protein
MWSKTFYWAWMGNSNGLYRDNHWADSVCLANTHGISGSETSRTAKPLSDDTLDILFVPPARDRSPDDHALLGHPRDSLTFYGHAPPIPHSPFQKIPLVIRTFSAAPPRKTGGKSGRSWHIPCFYLSLSIEVIETAGIGPDQ